MGSINRYIFRTTFAAFAIVLVSLTAVIWVTQALRDIDIMTSQGQNLLVFVGITGLIVPLLILVIAPIALLIAVAHVLNKLSTNSEIIVMNAAGMSPWMLLRAFIPVTTRGVAAGAGDQRLFRAQGPAHAARLAHRSARQCRQQHRAAGPLLHHRKRRHHPHPRAAQQRAILGIFLDDRRDPAERVTVLAEIGDLLDNDQGTFLILQKGRVQRQQANERDPAIVAFDRYAFDLSQFAGGPQAVKYSIRERYLWQLTVPDAADPLYKEQPGQFRAELFDRLIAPFYPLAFPGDRLRLSGRAAHQPAKPHPVACRRHRRRRLAAPDRLRLHRIRREFSLDGLAAIRRFGSPSSL